MPAEPLPGAGPTERVRGPSGRVREKVRALPLGLPHLVQRCGPSTVRFPHSGSLGRPRSAGGIHSVQPHNRPRHCPPGRHHPARSAGTVGTVAPRSASPFPEVVAEAVRLRFSIGRPQDLPYWRSYLGPFAPVVVRAQPGVDTTRRFYPAGPTILPASGLELHGIAPAIRAADRSVPCCI